MDIIGREGIEEKKEEIKKRGRPCGPYSRRRDIWAVQPRVFRETNTRSRKPGLILKWSDVLYKRQRNRRRDHPRPQRLSAKELKRRLLGNPQARRPPGRPPKCKYQRGERGQKKIQEYQTQLNGQPTAAYLTKLRNEAKQDVLCVPVARKRRIAEPFTGPPIPKKQPSKRKEGTKKRRKRKNLVGRRRKGHRKPAKPAVPDTPPLLHPLGDSEVPPPIASPRALEEESSQESPFFFSE